VHSCAFPRSPATMSSRGTMRTRRMGGFRQGQGARRRGARRRGVQRWDFEGNRAMETEQAVKAHVTGLHRYLPPRWPTTPSVLPAPPHQLNQNLHTFIPRSGLTRHPTPLAGPPHCPKQPLTACFLLASRRPKLDQRANLRHGMPPAALHYFAVHVPRTAMALARASGRACLGVFGTGDAGVRDG
jgi:hypothetical protein